MEIDGKLVVSSLCVSFFHGWFTFACMRYVFNMCRLDNNLAEGREFEPRANFFSQKETASNHSFVNQSTENSVEMENYA